MFPFSRRLPDTYTPPSCFASCFHRKGTSESANKQFSVYIVLLNFCRRLVRCVYVLHHLSNISSPKLRRRHQSRSFVVWWLLLLCVLCTHTYEPFIINDTIRGVFFGFPLSTLVPCAPAIPCAVHEPKKERARWNHRLANKKRTRFSRRLRWVW